MRPTQGFYTNFGSYQALNFDFSNLGLSLVSGPTGAGKSTLMDAVSWCLFGQTSKDCGVEDIKTWGTDEPTTGVQAVETSTGMIEVTRIRGRPSQNDLYWTEAKSTETRVRGKDINETQKLLETRLGVAAELYLAAAYFHQFSKADCFFVSRAKDRREILERISDLSLPITLGESSANCRKEQRELLSEYQKEAARLSGSLLPLQNVLETTQIKSDSWFESRSLRMEGLQRNIEMFEKTKEKNIEEACKKLEVLDKTIMSVDVILIQIRENKEKRNKLEELRAPLQKAQEEKVRLQSEANSLLGEHKKYSTVGNKICAVCLGQSENANKVAHLNSLDNKITALRKELASAEAKVIRFEAPVSRSASLLEEYDALLSEQRANNTNIEYFKRLKEEYKKEKEAKNTHLDELEREKHQINPYDDMIKGAKAALLHNKNCTAEVENRVRRVEHKIISLTQLYDLSFKLRGKLLEVAVKQVEEQTNRRLEKYFDGELRVQFVLDSDKINVILHKNGYKCSFSQLSGGQRCLLKLCFGTALMEASSNKAGIHFSCLFFDEALNGLDNELKVKAFSLFQELESNHESVILIDHCDEFKSLFTNQFTVSMAADSSTISQVEGTPQSVKS